MSGAHHEVRGDLRIWRFAFLAYAGAQVALSHWPHLSLGEPGESSPDKMLHVYVFAGLTVSFALARWTRCLLTVFLIMSGWVVIDELTQAIPALGRTITVYDMIASECGVLIACAWMAALRPVGGDRSRARDAFRARVLRSIFARPLRSGASALAWMLLAFAFLPIGIAITLLWGDVIDAMPNPVPAFLFGTGAALWLGMIVAIWNRCLWGPAVRDTQERGVCPHCGWATSRRVCDACGRVIDPCVWLTDVAPDDAIRRRMLARPAIIGLAFCGATFAAIYGFAFIYQRIVSSGGRIGWMQRLARELNNLPLDFTLTIDLTILMLAAALALYAYRRSWAKVYDRQASFCRKCGFELRGTPVDAAGRGACGECGVPFVRSAAASSAADVIETAKMQESIDG